MLNAKETAVIREKAYEQLGEIAIAGYEVEGRIKDGLVFADPAGNMMVLKVIMKKEGFDAADAYDEYEDIVAKRTEREAKAAEKVKEKAEAKAKRDAEKAAKAQAKAAKEAKGEDEPEVPAEPEIPLDEVPEDIGEII